MTYITLIIRFAKCLNVCACLLVCMSINHV